MKNKLYSIFLVQVGFGLILNTTGVAATARIPITLNGTLTSGSKSKISASFSGRRGTNSVRGRGTLTRRGGALGSYRGLVSSTSKSSNGTQTHRDRGIFRLSKRKLSTPFGSIRLRRPINPSKARQRVSGRGTVRVQVR